MKLTTRLAGLAVLASIGGAASAQDVIATVTNQWEGFYAGANIGGAWNTTCNTWEVNNVISGAIQNVINNRGCPNNGTFIGGVMLGYNFQYNEWVWGAGLDYEIWSGKNKTFTYVNAPGANAAPAGTYSFNFRGTPNGVFLLGPRVGYAIDNFLPYIQLGGVFTSGSHTSTATYTDADENTAVFTGSKNFKSSGFGASIGGDVMIADQLFFRATYTYVNLGKGTSTLTQCSGNATACAELSELELNNIHNSFTASLFRVGLAYKF
ncbi:MAG: outer membrane protein [Steroidobacteraceae bacterium]